jgi:hypothetical protein
MPFIYTLKSSTEQKCPWIVVNRIYTRSRRKIVQQNIFVTYWYPRKRNRKKTHTFFSDIQTRQCGIFKRILSVVHQFLARVRITTVWIMMMIVCLNGSISSILKHTPTLDATVQYKWWLTFFFIFLLLSFFCSHALSLSPSIRRDDAAVHIHLIRVDVHIYIYT